MSESITESVKKAQERGCATQLVSMGATNLKEKIASYRKQTSDRLTRRQGLRSVILSGLGRS